MSKSKLKIFNQTYSEKSFIRGLCLAANKIPLQFLVVANLLLGAFFFAGCKSETVNVPPIVAIREVTDDLGRRVKIPADVERAVSLAPNLTEITFAVGAGEKLVGVTTFCNYPAKAREIKKIGDTQSPNIESIIALKPQIVLVSTASQMENFSRTLEAQGIAVFVTNPNNLEDIYESVYKIGEIFRREEKARLLVDDLKRRVADVEAHIASAEDAKVFLQISREPLFTVGRTSFLVDLINRAGGASVTSNIETAYPKISKETAFALNPEAIILSDSEDNREPNEVFKNSPAVKNNRVFRVDADIISRPAPRVVDALEQIARALHPENFQ